jgi:alpha-acetolactate decarboxylase
MVVNEKRHRTEAQEWYFHLVNDPNEFEKCRYKDTINDYNILIAEFQKLNEQTPVTNRFIRARIQSGLKKSKRELAKTQTEYDEFKKYKARTTISK